MRPFSNALKIIGWTVGIVILLFFVAMFAAMAFGGSDSAFWGVSWLFLFVAPLVIVAGIILAIAKFVDGISRRRERNEGRKTVSEPD